MNSTLDNPIDQQFEQASKRLMEDLDADISREMVVIEEFVRNNLDCLDQWKQGIEKFFTTFPATDFTIDTGLILNDLMAGESDFSISMVNRWVDRGEINRVAVYGRKIVLVRERLNQSGAAAALVLIANILPVVDASTSEILAAKALELDPSACVLGPTFSERSKMGKILMPLSEKQRYFWHKVMSPDADELNWDSPKVKEEIVQLTQKAKLRSEHLVVLSTYVPFVTIKNICFRLGLALPPELVSSSHPDSAASPVAAMPPAPTIPGSAGVVQLAPAVPVGPAQQPPPLPGSVNQMPMPGISSGGGYQPPSQAPAPARPEVINTYKSKAISGRVIIIAIFGAGLLIAKCVHRNNKFDRLQEEYYQRNYR